jgi:hypothetical protein
VNLDKSAFFLAAAALQRTSVKHTDAPSVIEVMCGAVGESGPVPLGTRLPNPAKVPYRSSGQPLHAEDSFRRLTLDITLYLLVLGPGLRAVGVCSETPLTAS